MITELKEKVVSSGQIKRQGLKAIKLHALEDTGTESVSAKYHDSVVGRSGLALDEVLDW